MELHVHTFTQLFDQLGLDSSDSGIDKFIEKNSPLPPSVALHEADFWNPSQAGFLLEAHEDDADWVEIVNELDARLRYRLRR